MLARRAELSSKVWAALTGFLIGAPFALVVLATFTVEREERTALQRVNRLSRIAWREFRDMALNFCSDERFSGIQYDASEVYQCFAAALDDFATYRANAKKEVRTISQGSRYAAYVTTQDHHDQLSRDLNAHLLKWEKAYSAVNRKVLSSIQLQLLWSEVLANWSTLDQYVRLQRLERNLPGFDSSIHADLRNRFAGWWVALACRGGPASKRFRP